MFGIGLTEMVIIGIVALIFIGPDQLPEVARTVAKFLNDLRRNTDEIKHQFREASRIDLPEPPKESIAGGEGANPPVDNHSPSLAEGESSEPSTSTDAVSHELNSHESSPPEDPTKAKNSNES